MDINQFLYDESLDATTEYIYDEDENYEPVYEEPVIKQQIKFEGGSFEKFKAEMDTLTKQQAIKRLIEGLVSYSNYGNPDTGMSFENMQSISSELAKRGITMDMIRNNMTSKEKKLCDEKHKKPHVAITKDDYGIVIFDDNFTTKVVKKDVLTTIIKSSFRKPSLAKWRPSQGKMKGKVLNYWYEGDTSSTEKVNKIWRSIKSENCCGKIILTLQGERISSSMVKSYIRS